MVTSFQTHSYDTVNGTLPVSTNPRVVTVLRRVRTYDGLCSVPDLLRHYAINKNVSFPSCHKSKLNLLDRFLSIFFGYILARKDLFPAAASRGASQVTMNLSLPALIFANIVPAFTPQNISALGPLFLLAFVYQGIGFLFGLIIRELFYVPRNFWQGLIIITGMSNWGNLRE